MQKADDQPCLRVGGDDQILEIKIRLGQDEQVEFRISQGAGNVWPRHQAIPDRHDLYQVGITECPELIHVEILFKPERYLRKSLFEKRLYDISRSVIHFL